ncbi:MAG TPA: 3-deoxy-7-phosphoheptulonate synthase, partial [Burkholderiaceae bacterium]|nr:3-deoxy-7-phosphoheptulonate synthase [Burkholderiaceae bacterium]
PHHFLSVTKGGHSAIVSTQGNEDCHLILRGGKKPNYQAESVEAASAAIKAAGLEPKIMVDSSHANSNKDYRNQPLVIEDVAQQIAKGDSRLIGMMIESHLVGGRQDLVDGKALVYGQSITDGCIDWESTETVLEQLAEAVKARRTVRQVTAA